MAAYRSLRWKTVKPNENDVGVVTLESYVRLTDYLVICYIISNSPEKINSFAICSDLLYTRSKHSVSSAKCEIELITTRDQYSENDAKRICAEHYRKFLDDLLCHVERRRN